MPVRILIATFMLAITLLLDWQIAQAGTRAKNWISSVLIYNNEVIATMSPASVGVPIIPLGMAWVKPNGWYSATYKIQKDKSGAPIGYAWEWRGPLISPIRGNGDGRYYIQEVNRDASSLYSHWYEEHNKEHRWADR